MEQVDSSRADRLEQISRLKGNAAIAAARAEVKEMKKQYQANLGRTLMTGTRTAPPVNQREIDYQRGFYRGLLWAFSVFIDNAGPTLDKLLDAEMAERIADESGDTA